jgi:hypothetical protein
VTAQELAGSRAVSHRITLATAGSYRLAIMSAGGGRDHGA